MAPIVTRAQWGARSPKSRRTGSLSETSTVHWNGPMMPLVPHEKCASVVRGTQNFHMDGRGWQDIAYNFLVCRHGYIFEGRGLNVWNGANGTNYGNQTSHAVMALAGTGNVITMDMKQAIKDAIAHIDQRTNAPGSPVRGHRDHKSTECPGNELYGWVRAGLPVTNPKPQPAPVPLPSLEDDDMDTFLFRTTKETAIWLVSGNLMQKRWVQDRTLLEGYQTLLKANGLSSDVCVLNSTEPMAKAIIDVPAVGPTPPGYNGPKRN